VLRKRRQFDLMTESRNVDQDGCADILPRELGASLFKPKSRLEAENAALRHQLIVLQRKVRGRAQLTNSDRLFSSSCIVGARLIGAGAQFEIDSVLVRRSPSVSKK
jgi:hypothetical protein